MPLWKQVVLYAYFASLALLAVYGAHRCLLLYLFYRHRKKAPRLEDRFARLPAVTVQLPLFNEAAVVERLLDAVARIDYPRELLEVQVLDDSTDETRELARAKVAELRGRGLDVHYLHRSDRRGFKAGALAAGLLRARGEFLLIFDADFVPEPDVLHRSLHFFTRDRVAMVQVRWGHLNREYSLLTRLQALFLDGHFVIEHAARNRSGRHFNFNGTAGIWRRSAIEDAGGWQQDTLTEDLDLSYRARLRGWEFVFLGDVVAPAELPVEMNAFKNQQHRWAKGSIQTARKLLGRLWRSDLPLKVKTEATFHLTANCAYPLLLSMCLLMLPATLIRLEETSSWRGDLFDASVFSLATASVWAFYLAAQREVGASWLRALQFLPCLMCLGIGLAVNNARAVVEGFFLPDTPFVRTPKYNVVGGARASRSHRYRSSAHWMSWIEVLLGLYLSVVLGIAVSHGLWGMAVFLGLFATGFLSVGGASLLGRPPRVREETPRPVTAADAA